MNLRQKNALANACYIVTDTTNPTLIETEQFDDYEMITILKVSVFFGNEIWNAVIFIKGIEQQIIPKADLTENQQQRINHKLSEMLEGIGKDDIHFFSQESDFEALKMLTETEKKKLPKPNLFEIFDIIRRQDIALKNPFPSVNDLLLKKFTKVVRFSGLDFSTVLTINQGEEGNVWHASCSVLEENGKPMKVFETPHGYGMMRMEVVFKMLENVGSGQMQTQKPDKDSLVFHVWKRTSPSEDRTIKIAKISNEKSFIFGVVNN